MGAPDMVTATDTDVRSSITSTTMTALGNLSQSNTLAVAQDSIRTDAVNAVSFCTSRK